jgi:hypothetical protein
VCVGLCVGGGGHGCCWFDAGALGHWGAGRGDGGEVGGEGEVGDEYEYDGSTVCSVEDDK